MIRIYCIAGILAKSSADGHDDALEGRVADDEPDYQIPVRRLWPFGMRSRPPAGVEVVVVYPDGSPVSGVEVGAESSKYGPSDLEEGEAAVYCSAGGTIIKLDKDGNITIDAASGKDVIVNGGNAKVARVDDTTDNGTLVFNPGSGGASLSFVPPGGTVPPPGPAVNVPLSGKINSGAAHFKG